MKRLPTIDERKKKALIVSALETGKVLIHFDPRHPGVEVPEHLLDDVVLALNFSHHFPFANTTVTPLTIEANLSFSGSRFWCVVPHEAIFCVTSVNTDERHWFEDSLPRELKAVIEDPADENDTFGSVVEGAVEPRQTSGPTRPQLRLVK